VLRSDILWTCYSLKVCAAEMRQAPDPAPRKGAQTCLFLSCSGPAQTLTSLWLHLVGCSHYFIIWILTIGYLCCTQAECDKSLCFFFVFILDIGCFLVLRNHGVSFKSAKLEACGRSVTRIELCMAPRAAALVHRSSSENNDLVP
jgi:hypothetical protein